MIQVFGLNGNQGGLSDWEKRQLSYAYPFLWDEFEARFKRYFQPLMKRFLNIQFYECSLNDVTLESDGCKRLFIID